MPNDIIVSGGNTIIHNVKALNGNKHMKNDNTTVPNINMTCFL